MSFYNTAMSALDAKDFQSISELMHEDFIWMDGYDVKTLDEWLVGLKSEFERDFKFKDRKCLFENEDICAYQHFVSNDKGEHLRVTNVMLLKECKVYRATVIRIPEI